MGPYCRWYKSTVCFFCPWLPNCLTQILCLIIHATMPLSVCYTPNMCITGTKLVLSGHHPSISQKGPIADLTSFLGKAPGIGLYPTHLSMKEGSLFSFVGMRSTEPGCFRSSYWCFWKALDEEWCMGLVPWRLDLYVNKWYQNILMSECCFDTITFGFGFVNDLRPPKHGKRCQPFFPSGLTMASLPSDGFSQGTRDGHEWQLLPLDPCEGAQICCSLPQGTQLNTRNCKGIKAELALMYNCLTKQSQGELE